MPPAATTGTRIASTTCGSKAMVPTVVDSAVAGLPSIERCPPASPPCATITSVPSATATRASATVETMATSLMRRRLQLSLIRWSSQPSAAENAAGRSSSTTWIAASRRSGPRGGRLVVVGIPRRWRKRLSISWAPRNVASGIPTGSIGGRRSRCSQRFTPNGRSLSSRTRRIILRRSSGGTLSPARMPRPPTRHTSATSSGPAMAPMPDWTIGYSIPRRSQSAVRKLMALLQAIERVRVLVGDALGHVWSQLAENSPGPDEEAIQHRRLEEPRRPDIDADQVAIGHLFDERLPAGIERTGLRRQRGRPLEVHAGQIHTEIGITHQEPVETAGWPLTAVGEHDRRLAVGGQRAIERGLGCVGQLVVNDDRDAEFSDNVEDPAECRAVWIAIDQLASDLTHVNLADHPWSSALELDLELARRGVRGRIGQGQAGHHAIGILLACRRQPDRVLLLAASD